jgi:hypothetical protein
MPSTHRHNELSRGTVNDASLQIDLAASAQAYSSLRPDGSQMLQGAGRREKFRGFFWGAWWDSNQTVNCKRVTY